MNLWNFFSSLEYTQDSCQDNDTFMNVSLLRDDITNILVLLNDIEEDQSLSESWKSFPQGKIVRLEEETCWNSWREIRGNSVNMAPGARPGWKFT